MDALSNIKGVMFMAEAHENSLIRILSTSGAPVGTGFLLSEIQAVTCAHVVAQALRQPLTDDMPAAALTFDFPLLAPGQLLTVRAFLWDSALDVAVLQITGDLPAGAQPASLVQSPDLWKHDFRAFGFPGGFPNGVWASGRILGREASGWFQIEDTKQTGYFVQPGFSGGAVWDEALGGVVGLVVAADTREETRAAFLLPVERLAERFPDLRAQVRIVQPAASTEPAPGEPPYMGLRYFDTGDADLFHGRAALTRELTGRLAAGERFLAIVGASGSGKSSLARAGLVTAWQAGIDLPGGSLGGPVHVITPTSHPLESLAASLTRDSESVTATATLTDDLRQDPRSLHLAARKLLSQAGAAGMLLLVDQFEETFTLCKDPAERKAFIENLLCASCADEHAPLRVVLTLPADFYHHCAEYDGLRQALQAHQAFIGAMTPDELREAIAAPARAAGWDFQPGLVDLILQDVGQEPGALPLLSHALLETWKRRQGRTLTLDGYAAAGGVRKAIAQTAETVYDRLTSADQAIARGIFLRLTELGEGVQDTRRRASLAELAPAPGGQSAVDAVLKILADARLVTTAQDSAEVAHEALIREWPTLRKWLEEDRESLRLHRHLTDSAREWEQRGREPGELYRGARLAQTLEWAAGHENALSPQETDFLRASQDVLQRERRAARLRWASVAGAGLLVLMTIVLALTGELNRFIYRPLDMADYWVNIPAGEFMMGSEYGGADERPVHSVNLNTFQIGRYEITNRQYAQCVRAGACNAPGNSRYASEEYSKLPVTYVSWNDARDFCDWVGGQLPTEAEWEFAARGGLQGKQYPWGDEEPSCDRGARNGANYAGCDDNTLPVGFFTPNSYGLYDMAGNVWEWISDWYSRDYYATLDTSVHNPSGSEIGDTRVLRGGSLNSEPYFLRVSLRYWVDPNVRHSYIGFRCAR
jgi:formylglycine-generating enzyme required for sulfatase activity/S1-C subfamily serine protease